MNTKLSTVITTSVTPTSRIKSSSLGEKQSYDQSHTSSLNEENKSFLQLCYDEYDDEIKLPKEHENLVNDDTGDGNSMEDEIRQNLNLVQLCGVSSMYCGYCHSTNKCTSNIGCNNNKKSVSYGLYFDRLHSSDYVKLLNEGWRRSGKNLYKPHNDESCCPCYSIRLPLSSFTPSKHHRKVLRRIQNLLSPQPLSSNICKVPPLTTFTNINMTNINDKNNSELVSKPLSGTTELLSLKSQEIQQAIHAIIDPQLLFLLFPSITTQCSSENGIGMEGRNSTPSEKKNKKNNQRKKSKSLSNLCQFQLWKNIPKRYFQQFDINTNKSSLSSQPSIHTSSKDLHQHSDRIYMVASTNIAIALTHMSLQIKQKQKKYSQTYQKNPKPDDHDLNKTIAASVDLANSIIQFMTKEASSNFHPTKYDNGKHKNSEATKFSLHVHPSTGQIHLWLHQKSLTPFTKTAHSLVRNYCGMGIQDELNKAKKSNISTSNGSCNYDHNPSFKQNNKQGNKNTGKIKCNEKIQSVLEKRYDPSSLSSNSRTISREDGLINPRFYMSVEHVPSYKSARQPDVHRLFCKYQSIIHGDKDPYLIKTTKKKQLISSLIPNHATATNDIVKNCCRRKRKHQDYEQHKDMESSQQKYQSLDVYDIYQDDCDREDGNDDNEDTMLPNIALTMDDIHSLYAKSYSRKQRNAIYRSYSSFYRFLCESPFPSVSSSTSNYENKESKNMEGCFHFQYYIHDSYENKKHLMAVGVLDKLSSCVSSVYAFYDPELSSTLELGKLTALYEIQWAQRQHRQHQNELQYYYLGYYIHSCMKMKYKAQFKPSQLLCCTYYKWIDFDRAKTKIEQFLPKYLSTLYNNPSNEKTKCQVSIEGKRKENFLDSVNDETCVHQKASKHDDHDNKYFNLDQLFLDIGGPSIIQAGVLPYQYRSMVTPLLREFLEQVCPDVAKRCVIKLSD